MWLAGTKGIGSVLGFAMTNVGKVFWRGIQSGWKELIMPTSVNALTLVPTWTKYKDSMIGTGGWSENIIISKDWQIRTLGIRAPTVVPTVANAAGPGITADVICYLAYYDERMDEWSPLSAPSATLSPVNQTIAWTVLPQSPNPRVTHIGLWRSVNGALPRLVQIVQRGCVAITEAVTTANLGVAWVDDFEQFPRCKVCTTWHDMLVLAGDEQHPSRIYFSIIGYPERWGYLYLDTKTSQPVIALAVVRDQLLVFCPRATERVSGWDESDLRIEIAQPQVGCVTAHGIQTIHEMLWVPTHLGIQVTDGNGWHFAMKDVYSKWEAEFATYQDAYENAWSYHDPIYHVYALCVGTHTDCYDPGAATATNTYWVADYTTVVPQVGGSLEQPRWSYDVEPDTSGGTSHATCAGLLSWPGARRGDLYLGREDGDLHKLSGAGTGRYFPIRLQTGAEFGGDIGGDLAHGKRWSEMDLFVRSDDKSWTFAVYAGHEECTWRPKLGDIGLAIYAGDPQYSETVAASAATLTVGGPATYYFEALTVHHRQLPKVVGQSITLFLACSQPITWDYRGYSATWKMGPNPRWVHHRIGTPS